MMKGKRHLSKWWGENVIYADDEGKTSLAQMMRGKSTCPGHAKRIASLSADATLLEDTAGVEMGREVDTQCILQHLVTDRHAHNAEGVKAGMCDTTCKVEWQADTTK